MKGSSVHAHQALKELNNVDWLNGVIRGCIWDPQLGTPDKHPNIRFFGEVERYLTGRQIAHAGDTLNTYCQNILAAILDADASQWSAVQNLLRAKTREEAIAALHKQRENDTSVRKSLRERLGIFWCNELEIICALRNKMVHQAGIDHEGEVLATTKLFPPGQHPLPPPDLARDEFPIECSADGTLLVDARSAHWATRHVSYQIHLMDQNICYRFCVAREPRPMPSLGFHMREGSHPRILFPGSPLPKPPAIPAPSPAPSLPELPPLQFMADPKEQACMETWNHLRRELDAAVRSICDKCGLQIDGIEGNVAGHPSSHTIAHHELHACYDLSSPDPSVQKSNRIGIRMRQRNLAPFVTIWSTKTVMRDFNRVDDLTQMKEELTAAIHATLS